VASFNTHAGVDGWGRPYDVVAACRRIDADVLVLQEVWTPVGGGPPGTAEQVAGALAYRVDSFPLARCVLYPPAGADVRTPRWGPRPGSPHRRRCGLRLVGGDPGSGTFPLWRGSSPWPGDAGPHGRPGRALGALGTWGLAVLSRVPLSGVDVVDLGRLPRDRARRAAIVVEVDAAVAGRPLRVVGTHMSHLTQGSPRQLRRLALWVGGVAPALDDTVVAGDMNLWGPPVSAALPGLRRVVRGRTWPAWRPVAQVDHILAGPRLAAGSTGEVVADGGSDHRPVRARLRLE